MSVETEYQATEHLFPLLPARISSLLGLDVAVARQAVSVMVPTMIDGLAARASSSEIAREIADILARTDRNAIGVLGRMAPGTQHYRYIEGGLGALTRALGTTGLASLTQTIVRQAGLTEPAALDIAGMVAPVVFAALAQHQAGQGLSPVGVAALLRQQREHIGGTTPPSPLVRAAVPATVAPVSFPAPPREPPQPPLYVPQAAIPVQQERPAPVAFPGDPVPSRAAPPPALAGPLDGPLTSAPVARHPLPPPRETDDRAFDWRWLAALPIVLLLLGGGWWYAQMSPFAPDWEQTVGIGAKNRENDRIRDTERARLEFEAAQRAKADAEERAAQQALAEARAAEARRQAEARAKREAEQRAAAEALARAQAEEARRAAVARRETEARFEAEARARADAEAEARRQTELKKLAAAAALDDAKARAEVRQCQDEIRNVIGAGTIRFKRASSVIEDAANATLDRISQSLVTCPAARVKIEGHTSTDGGTERNQRLSEARAEAVAEYLARAGIDPRRMTWNGYGETRPITSNRTESGRARNRRIEFVLE